MFTEADVEVVAKAIAASCDDELPWERMPEPYREGHRLRARAALEAIEPAVRRIRGEYYEQMEMD